MIVRFEQAMYADPGRDLAATWWDLVDSLQGLRRPQRRATPDWASKIHLAVAPVYYQSYLLGELLAFQVDAAVREAVVAGAMLLPLLGGGQEAVGSAGRGSPGDVDAAASPVVSSKLKDVPRRGSTRR